jgi:hypothetical protein
MARPIGRNALLIVVLPMLAAFLLWAFAWPAARVAPRDLPLGVAGPDSAVARVEEGLAGHAGSGAFTFHWYADATAAKAGIEDREVYGAVVAGPQGVQVLTASAAAPAVATLLQQTAAHLPGGPVPVVDVVALPSADPRGSAFAASVLPTVVVGLATGALACFVLSGLRQRLTVLVLSAVTVGATAAVIANSWLGMLTGSVVAGAAVVALVVLAVSAAVCGLGTLLRHKGVGLAALVLMLLGNAWSGVSSAPELLPGAVSVTGRLLPPGAGAAALRDTAFFDGHGAGGPLEILAAWAVLGIVLTAVGTRSAQRRLPAHAASATAAMPALVPDPVEAVRR